MTAAVLPGATIGVLGGGQLGRMLALAARRMGYRTAVFVPAENTPGTQAADLHVCAPYEDLDAVERFARSVSTSNPRSGSRSKSKRSLPSI